MLNCPLLLLPLPRDRLVRMPVNARAQSSPATIQETSSSPSGGSHPELKTDRAAGGRESGCKAHPSMGRRWYAALMDKPQDTPTLPARYYRQKAVEARQAAEEATTRAIKERLHGSARDFDKLADAADRAG